MEKIVWLVLTLVTLFAMGVLVLGRGRRAELGMLGILGMQAGLLLFGWLITVPAAVMLIAVGLLLRAQRRHDRRVAQSVPEPAAAAPQSAAWWLEVTGSGCPVPAAGVVL
jgi:uncharacterized membrane protein